jgi:hypothetical protein
MSWLEYFGSVFDSLRAALMSSSRPRSGASAPAQGDAHRAEFHIVGKR